MFHVQEPGEEKYIYSLNYGTFMHMVKNIMKSNKSEYKFLPGHILAEYQANYSTP